MYSGCCILIGRQMRGRRWKEIRPKGLSRLSSRLGAFRYLTLGEAGLILRLCQPKSFRSKEIVYKKGDSSDGMFILLQGKLRAINESGDVWGDIFPGGTTGEMGALTGRQRVATVVALESCAGFKIQRDDLDRLMKSNEGLRIKILENMVGILCDRIEGANDQIENYAKKGRL